MNKALKTFLIISIIFIIVGGALVSAAFGFFDFKISDFGTERYELMTAEITEDITEISVNTDSENVRIIRSDSGTTTVTYPESDRLHYNVCVDESDDGSGYMLTVKKHIEAKEKWFNIGFYDPEIIIAVPSECMDMISVVTSSGDIAVESGIIADKIYCTSSSGNITADSDEVKSDLYIKTSSGSVEATAPAHFLSVTTSSGGVKVENSDYHDVLISSKSGDISMKSVTLDSTEGIQRYGLETTSGRIVLIDVVGKTALSAKTSSGDIILSRTDAARLTFESSSGDIKGTVASPKLFVAKSSSGSIKVPEPPDKMPADRCIVTTSSGNIHLEVYETGEAE